MVKKNKFGLKKHIPEKVRAVVRRQSQFGCVRCRKAVYQYEHIDPPYAETKVHEADKICLLCGSCHDAVTRGQIAKETIAAHYRETQAGTADPPWSGFDLSGRGLVIQIGGCRFTAPRGIFRINGKEILAFEPPEVSGAPPRLTGEFYDASGKRTLVIERNEYTFSDGLSDVRIEGRVLRIQSENGPALEIEMRPPNELRIRSPKNVQG
jgi:hypothetical protein